MKEAPIIKPDTPDTLPCAIDAEQAIASGIMFDNAALARVMPILKPSDFYSTPYALIYKTAIALHEQAKDVDMISVAQALQDSGDLGTVGGKAAIATIASHSFSSVNIDQYAAMVLDKSKRRQMIRYGHSMVKLGYEEGQPIEAVMDSAESQLFTVTQEAVTNKPESVAVTGETVMNLLAQPPSDVSGLASGFYDLDAMTQGFQRSDLIVIGARPAMGKCLGKGTNVYMFDGTLKSVENVRVGDLLMGPDSKPRKVLSLARGREMMYWVRQNRGIDYRVNESHILSLKRSGSEGRSVHGEVTNISVRDYVGKSNKFKARNKGYKVSVDFSPRALLVDPYYLGIWLGDGNTRNQRIHNPDSEVIDYLSEFSESNGYRFSSIDAPGKCPVNTVCGTVEKPTILHDLRSIGVIGNKHIPSEYLASSKEQRLQLLAGLMDSDGYYCPKYNCFENTQKVYKLALGMKLLADSLGFRTSIVEKIGKIASTGFEGVYWRVRVSGNLEIIPTKVERKKARKYVSNRDWRVTGITVEADCVDDYYGFTIDGDHLFLLEDMTVTHNTSFVEQIAHYTAANAVSKVLIFSMEMSKEQLYYRTLSRESRVDSGRLRTRKIAPQEWETIGNAVSRINQRSVIVDETPGISVSEMRSKARQVLAEHKGLDMIVIDYLQLMGGNSDNRVTELSKITRSLKCLARELNVPILLLSQLSRGVESRTNKRPMMSDLRESGAIEQDADMIMMLYREEYYDPDTPDRGVAEVIIAKHRNGPTGTVKLLFEPEFTTFRNRAKDSYDSGPETFAPKTSMRGGM